MGCVTSWGEEEGRERQESGKGCAPVLVAAERGRYAREDARKGKEDKGAEARDG